MPWFTKEVTTPFDTTPPEGLLYLIGDLLARNYHQDRVKGKKYPVIHFPSGLQRELSDSSAEGGIINVFGAFELLRQTTRDEGYTSAVEFASEYGYSLGRRGDNELLVFHPHTGHGYAVTYDIAVRQIINVKRFPTEAMDLLDAESRAILPELFSNEELSLDAIAPVKFFTPDSSWTWWATEYDGEDTLFGLVSGLEVELGYFSVSELEGIQGTLGLPVERDLYFTATTLRKLMAQQSQ